MLRKVIVYTGCLVFAALWCTGCVYSGLMMDGIISSKSVWFIFLSGFTLILLGANYIFNKSCSFNLLDIITSILLLYMILNNFYHDNELISKRNVEDAGLLLTYFFAKRLLINKKFPDQVFIVFILGLTLFQIIIAFLQWFKIAPSYNSNFKFTGFFFNPSPFSIFLAVLLVYCLATALFNSIRALRTIGSMIFLAGVPVVLITLSRSASIGLFMGSLFLLFIKTDFFKIFRRKAGALSIKIVACILVLTISLFAAYYLYEIKKDSADGRLLTWKISYTMLADRFFSGFGQGGFQSYFLKYQYLYFRSHPYMLKSEGRLAGQVVYAFNDILQIAVEQGIIGLVLFIALLLLYGKNLYYVVKKQIFILKYNNGLVIGSAACVIVIVISGLFSYPLVLLPIQILFYTALPIVANNSLVGRKKNLILQSSRFSYKFINFGMVISYLIAGISYINYSISACHAYKLGYTINTTGYTEIALRNLGKSKFILQQESWFLLMGCDYLLKSGRYDEATSELEQAKNFTSDVRVYYALGRLYTTQKSYRKAENQYEFLCYALPDLIKPKYMLAKLYYDTGQSAKWKKKALEIIKYKPKIESPPVDDMQFEIEELLKKDLMHK